jgi:pyridoxine kinase
MLPNCAAIHDLCCYAKSSLTVVLPVLEAQGVECSPLPTALLSSQTDGFTSYHFRDATDDLEAVLSAWEQLSLSFDAVYSGFLGSATQVSVVERFIRQQREHTDPLVLVDPVLGDDQMLYGPITMQQVKAMRSLVKLADVITPNTTEAALLLDQPMRPVFDERTALEWAGRLGEETGVSVVITSVDLGSTKAVAVYDAGVSSLVPYASIPVSYPGSGDLFASLLLGSLVHKQSLQTSVSLAIQLTSLAIARTLDAGYERRHGIAPSLILDELTKRYMRHEM